MAHADNLRRHFPAVRTVAYLNTGTFGPLPDSAITAMKAALDAQLQQGRFAHETHATFAQVRREIREQLAALFHVKPEHFALVDSTTHAMNIVLWGLPLDRGDEIIYTNVEHPGSLLPVYIQKQRRGVVLKRLDVSLSEDELISNLQALLTSRTRVIVVSHVSYQTGQRLPIEKIAQLAHREGAYCLVDGAQGAGAEPLSLGGSDIDFYAFPGQKWLCGPDGTGALYIAPRLLHVLDPTYVGASTLEEPHLYNFSGDYLGAETARRYEHTHASLVNWVGFLESLKFLRVRVGWDYAFTRIHGLSGSLLDQLLDVKDVRLVTPREARVGIVSFQVQGMAADRFVEEAKSRAIDIRYIRERDLVRVCCGFYNNENDLQRLVNLLKVPR